MMTSKTMNMIRRKPRLLYYFEHGSQVCSYISLVLSRFVEVNLPLKYYTTYNPTRRLLFGANSTDEDLANKDTLQYYFRADRNKMTRHIDTSLTQPTPYTCRSKDMTIK